MAFLPVCLFVSSVSVAQMEQTNTDLELVRKRIDAVEKEMEETQGYMNSLEKDLEEIQRDIDAVDREMERLDQEILERESRLEHLNQQQQLNYRGLSEQQDYLAQYLRAAHKIGNHDYIKLLFNQNALKDMQRALSYYRYYNRMQIRHIEQSKARITNIRLLQDTLETEFLDLESLRTMRMEKLGAFNDIKRAQQNMLARLDARMRSQDSMLAELKQEEASILKLLESFKDDGFVAPVPFAQLRGKLAWPLQNVSIVHQFGSRKSHGDLRWQGVLLRASPGDDVKAISHGRVIYSDRFHHLGLLIIIEHGMDYMSLYGHNQEVFKKVGDWVAPDEVIATVGAYPRQALPALYFEIRRGAKPLNPSHWCRG